MPAAQPRNALVADIAGGVTTFLAMAYMLVVNPSILSASGAGIPFSGALTATVLIASSMTLLMGFYARLPFAVAPGMGLNAFFAVPSLSRITCRGRRHWASSSGPECSS